MDDLKYWQREQARLWLESVKNSMNRLRFIEDELNTHITLLDGLKSARLDIRQCRNGAADRTGNAVIELQNFVDKYESEVVELVQIKNEALSALMRIQNAQCVECLTKHYLLGKKWKVVADEMHYSLAGIKSLRRRALLEAFDVMPHYFKTRIPSAKGEEE